MSDVLLQKTGRLVAIAHRVKARVVNGEKVDSLPTRVLIVNTDGTTMNLDLDDDNHELDFVQGRFATRFEKEKDEEGNKVPVEFQGLRPDDTILMTLGGSGDPLAYAISRKGEDVGFTLYRMSASMLKALRGNKPSDQKKRDSSELETLVKAWQEKLAIFHKSDAADRTRIRIGALYRAYKENQQARIGQGARLRQSAIGAIFMSVDGLFPEGSMMQNLMKDFTHTFKKHFQKKSKPLEVYEALVKAENNARSELEKAVESSHLWKIFEPIIGIGPSIAGGLISSIGDIRKFPTEAAFWAFCGLHTLKTNGVKLAKGEQPIGGIMARRRTGQLSNWNPTLKQSLYMLADQFNRRPDSYWGKKLRLNKKLYRIKYPTAMKNEADKLRYSDGHIHNMALWKTLRQFTRWLYRDWTRLENDPAYVVKQPVWKNGMSVEALPELAKLIS